MKLKCSDGESFRTPTGAERETTPAGRTFKITHSRKWVIHEHGDVPSWDVLGRFNASGSKATGTLSVSANFDDGNVPDPNGPIHCQSGTLKFSLKRK